jgi:hypothetical protein
MSIARGVLLIAAGMALGIPCTMIVNGDIELPWQIEAFRFRAPSLRPAATTAADPAPSQGPVAFAQPAIEPRPEAVVVTLPSVGPSAGMTPRLTGGERLSLARDLQKELNRAGCYGGSIDGIWTPASQRAMKGFMDRVNAQLPLEEPNHVLLALAQSRQGIVCAKPCRPPADNSCVEEKAAERSTIALKPSTPTEARLIQGGSPFPGQLAPEAPPPTPPQSQPRKKAQRPNQGFSLFKSIFGPF